MKVMIAAGGTGGHIYPALALAQVLKQKKPESEIVFFGSSNRMEAEVIPSEGYRFYGMEMTGTNGGISAKVKSLLSMKKAEKEAVKILKKEKPEICVGFGNYISVPLINAAHKLHIPIMIHEQNSFAGKANRYLAHKADAVISCYASNLEQMPSEHQLVLGNPEATLAGNTVFDREEVRSMGLDPDKPFAVFMMGSLGSSSVSRVIDEAVARIDPELQLIVAAGRSNSYTFKTKGKPNVRIVPYVNGRSMLKGCTLAVLRAGATTMCEVSAIGCASILIPSPYVPNNHQYYNAMELVKKDAAVLIEEKDLSTQRLAETINRLVHDPEKLAAMRQNAYAMGKRDAAYRMIDRMEELVK